MGDSGQNLFVKFWSVKYNSQFLVPACRALVLLSIFNHYWACALVQGMALGWPIPIFLCRILICQKLGCGDDCRVLQWFLQMTLPKLLDKVLILFPKSQYFQNQSIQSAGVAFVKGDNWRIMEKNNNIWRMSPNERAKGRTSPRLF